MNEEFALKQLDVLLDSIGGFVGKIFWLKPELTHLGTGPNEITSAQARIDITPQGLQAGGAPPLVMPANHKASM